MLTPVVIISNISFYSTIKLVPILCQTKINIFPLYRTPESLYPHIIKASLFSIHANKYFVVFQTTNPSGACELGTLVRIDYFWHPIPLSITLQPSNCYLISILIYRLKTSIIAVRCMKPFAIFTYVISILHT